MIIKVFLHFRILRTGNAFITLDAPLAKDKISGDLSDYNFLKCKRFNVKTIISSKILNNLLESYKSYSIKDLSEDKSLFFVNYAENESSDNLCFPSSEKILYAIQTSGSTGEPKTVHVPARAIMPNIVDFVFDFFIL